MGKLIKSLPGLYYDEENNLRSFVEALDPVLELAESEAQDLSALIDVDRCPVGKLPYLAALTGAPLSGSSAVLWRRQIRNWPYILRYKGTLRSLQLYLLALGVPDYEVYTYWRDDTGEYVIGKPEGGAPYLAESGLWNRSRTHYYGLKVLWDEKVSSVFDELLGPGFSLKEVEALLSPVVPYHAELLRFSWGFFFEDSLPLRDDVEDNLSVRTLFPFLDIYPWGGLRYGFFNYGDMLRYGGFAYGDVNAYYGGGAVDTPRYGDDMPDLLDLSRIRMSGLVESYSVPSVYGEVRHGEFSYGGDKGPRDCGGAIEIRRPLVYGRFRYGDGCVRYGEGRRYGEFSYGGGPAYGGEVTREVI